MPHLFGIDQSDCIYIARGGTALHVSEIDESDYDSADLYDACSSGVPHVTGSYDWTTILQICTMRVVVGHLT